MRTILKLLVVCQLVLISCQETVEENSVEQKFWYEQPAANWMEALPVGNGRLGAMVFGDPHHERIQLNEDSMWAGGPDWGDAHGTPEDLKELRRLINEGDVHTADKYLVDKFSFKSVKRSHQTMGDLFIDFKEKKIEDYHRELNLNKAYALTSYIADGSQVTQKVFASNPDNVLIVQLETADENGLDFSLKLNRPEDHGNATVKVSAPSQDELLMEGMVTQYGGSKFSEPIEIDYGVKFDTRLKVKHEGGSVNAENGQLQLKGVKRATLYIVCETSFYNENYKELAKKAIVTASQKNASTILEDHIADYQSLYHRADLNLGGQELDTIATDKRLERIKNGHADLDLISKMFHYGRYLLISSSRPNTNPANLQGIWNEHIEAPWNADYHVNINLQMNYWPAEVTNIGELNQPLFNFIDRLIERGKNAAKEQYGMKGSMIHHTSDLWATPWMRGAQAYWGAWFHGGGWMVQHYWESFLYNQDEEFLRNRAYPAIKEIAIFYLDWLVKDTDGTWVSTPSSSPENSYIAPDGKPAALSKGDAMSHQIIGEVFDNILASAKILNIEDDFVKAVREKKKDLKPGLQLGEDGRILEWDRPYEEAEKGHRHMSHLYALHPGDDITEATPEFFEGAKKVIEYRLQHGGAGTGWSRAWMINFYARLLESEKAYENLQKFTEISLANNMFDMHPPFQIDGNFGVTAGITEMLMQSHEGFIRVLPTLPKEWKEGKITGLRARGGFEVSIFWKEGKLEKLEIISLNGKPCNLKYNGINKSFELFKGDSITLNGALEIVK